MLRGNTLFMAAQCFDPAPVVLLTRPAEQSARFAQDLRHRFGAVQIVTSPLMAPVFVDPTLPEGPFAAVILSSETGAQAAASLKARLPDHAFCVGDRTAAAARLAGFAATSAQGDAAALLALILSDPPGPLLHLRGQDTRGDLARRLSASGVPTVEAVVYAQTPQPLTAAAVTLLTGAAPVLAPLFSPRSAAILGAECVRIAATAPIHVVALSPAVAEAARFSIQSVQVADQPNAKSLIQAMAAHFASGQSA
jgi:uroporphyrinogen-III synthase